MISRTAKSHPLLRFCHLLLLSLLLCLWVLPGTGRSAVTVDIEPQSTAKGTSGKKGKIIREDPADDGSVLLVSKSEFLKAGLKDYHPRRMLQGKSSDISGDKMHLDALTKTVVKRSLDRNAQHIKNLESGVPKNRKATKKYRKITSALHSNPVRAGKIIAVANGSKTPVVLSKGGLQHVKGQALTQLKNQTAIQNELTRAHKNKARIVASHSRYRKTQRTAGFIGQVMSIWDARQNAYYYDEKTKKTSFSTSAYLTSAAMNLSGVAGFVSTYKEGQRATQEEYKRALDEYVAAGAKRDDPAVISKAWRRAVTKGVLVGVYNGAKCIPLAGDALNVFELSEATIGLVHDTLESERIIAENEVEQARQGRSAVSKLKTLFAQIKTKESEFKSLQKEAEAKGKRFALLNRQYIEVFNRLVTQGENLRSADSLLEAADKAKPYMDANRIATLKTDSEKMIQATATTVKLAKTTLENYQANGGDPGILNSSREELQQMLSSLTAYKGECDDIKTAIAPLLGGAEILEGAREQGQQISTDTALSNNLYKDGAALLREYRQLVTHAERLKREQDANLAKSKSLLSYFYRNGDPSTKTDLEIAFREAVQYTIDDYDIKKLNEGHKTVAIRFQGWREMASPTTDMPPDLAVLVNDARSLSPGIAENCEVLDRSIASTQDFLQQFTSPDGQFADTGSVGEVRATWDLKDKELYNISLADLKKQIQFRERGGAIRAGADLCGYQAYSYSSQIGNLLSGSVDKDVCARQVETGTTIIYDHMTGKKKKVKYTIWFTKSINHVSGWWPEYSQREARLQETFEDEVRNYNVQSITIKNAHDAFIGKLKEPLNNIVRGFAFNVPFDISISGWVDCRVGDDVRFSTRYKDPYDQKYWGLYFDLSKSKENLQERMQYWESQLNSEMAANLTAHMEVPAQMIAFTNKNFIRDVRPLFNGLSGYVLDLNGMRPNYGRQTHVLKKKWERNGGFTTTMRVSVTIDAKYPSTAESWNTLIRGMHERLQTRSQKYNMKRQIRKLDLSGADMAYGYLKTDTRTLKRRGHTIQAVHQNGSLKFIVKNVHVSITVSAGNLPPNEKIDIYAIARTILANF